MIDNRKPILCIDDDEDTCGLVVFAFRQIGVPVETAGTAAEGLSLARESNFAAIVLDNRFEHSSGVEICREIRSFDDSTPIIFFSAEARPAEINKAFSVGASAYLIKPQDFEKLVSTTLGFIN